MQTKTWCMMSVTLPFVTLISKKKSATSLLMKCIQLKSQFQNLLHSAEQIPATDGAPDKK